MTFGIGRVATKKLNRPRSRRGLEMNKPARIAAIAAAILLLLSGTIYGWRSYSNGRKLAELKAQVKAMAENPPERGPREAGAERGSDFGEIRERVRELPESYQQQFRRSMANSFQSRDERRLDAYLKLSPAERRKHLDKEIAEREERRKEWEARRRQRQASGENNRGNGGPRAEAGRGGDGARDGGSGPPRGNWGGGGRGMSARLDNSTPAYRAKRA
jgi:hypothetical protein